MGFSPGGGVMSVLGLEGVVKSRLEDATSSIFWLQDLRLVRGTNMGLI